MRVEVPFDRPEVVQDLGGVSLDLQPDFPEQSRVPRLRVARRPVPEVSPEEHMRVLRGTT